MTSKHTNHHRLRTGEFENNFLGTCLPLFIDFTSDPYNHEEKDPAKSNALESCLWELETLQSHYHHGVATRAKQIHQPLPKLEEDLSDLLDLDVADVSNEIRFYSSAFASDLPWFGAYVHRQWGTQG